MSPEAYHDSLRRAAAHVRLEEGQSLLDAGCGSGMLLPLVAGQLKPGNRYFGLDNLTAGLRALDNKSRGLRIAGRVSTLQADLSQTLPLQDNAVHWAVAHFSVYTLTAELERCHAWRELYRVLKPEGLLIAANPTAGYDAGEIIRESAESLEGRVSPAKQWIIENGIYPLTRRLGLRHIQQQIRSGRWHGYTLDEFRGEVEGAGFTIEHHETVYAGNGILIVARKPQSL